MSQYTDDRDSAFIEDMAGRLVPAVRRRQAFLEAQRQRREERRRLLVATLKIIGVAIMFVLAVMIDSRFPNVTVWLLAGLFVLIGVVAVRRHK